MKIPHFIILVGSMCCVLEQGKAAVITTLSPTAPVDQVQISYTVGTPIGLQWRYDVASGRRDVGQSFLATDSFIFDSFSFQLQQTVPSGAPGANFTVSIFESSTISSVGSVISTQTGVLAGLISGSGAGSWITFDIANLAVSSGLYYSFVLSFDAQVANQTLNFNSISPGAYAGGSAWISSNGSAFTVPAGQDLLFYVQSIPEPSTVATLIAVASVVVVGRLMRLRRVLR